MYIYTSLFRNGIHGSIHMSIRFPVFCPSSDQSHTRSASSTLSAPLTVLENTLCAFLSPSLGIDTIEVYTLVQSSEISQEGRFELNWKIWYSLLFLAWNSTDMYQWSTNLTLRGITSSFCPIANVTVASS